MFRPNAFTLEVLQEASIADKAEILNLITEGKAELGYHFDANVLWVKKEGEDRALALLKKGAVKHKKNFPTIYEKVSATDKRDGKKTLDGKYKYVKLTPEDYAKAKTVSRVVPEKDVAVTREFIEGLKTKTALVAWLKKRGIFEEVNGGKELHKDELFEATFKYFFV